MQNEAQKKLTLRALILMIFTSVFGFTNIPKAFYLMGYAAIPWYIFAAITFFLPFALMMAEFGSAFKDEEGGIYSWMAASMSPKYGFIVTFMWYASYIIWMVNVGTGIWIVLSNAIWGVDTTQSWTLFGLSSVKVLGLLAILWLILITFISTKGLEKIQKITSVAGTAIALINIFLFVGGILIIALNGGFQEPLAGGFTHSPNPSYQDSLSVLSFVVYAIFAFGGIEVIGGLVDQTENAEVTFPRGVAISAIIISIGYAVGILLVGGFTNWEFAYTQFAEAEVTMGNVAYITMNNMGYQLGLAFGMAETAARNLGTWISRYMGVSMFLALSGSFFTIVYSPLKQLIGGTPKEIWPEKWTIQENGMYVNAMKAQAIVVIILIAIVSFGGSSAKKFFDMLIAMTNVSMTLPYLFLAIAFIGFKKNDKIEKSFVGIKNELLARFAVAAVILIVGFANVFTIINPAMNGDFLTTIMSIAGPVFFTIVAFVLFNRYEKKQGLKS